MTTLHILSCPYAATTPKNRVDPFPILTYKFINHMMAYGWNCIHYGTVGSEVECEDVVCNSELSYLPPEYPGHVNTTTDRGPNTQRFNHNAGIEISKRKRPGDIIICFHGIDNKGACDANPDLKAVEASIGYDNRAVFAPYRVFTSYAHMHMFYGQRDMLMNPSWFDAVIPNAISQHEFEFYDKKEDYFVCLGRVIEKKGIHLAIQATQEAGVKLKIAGPGSLQDLGYKVIPGHVEYLGIVDVDTRKRLLSRARGIIGATYYIEPFGNMVAEALMSGTPAITTDWGGFVDTNIHGLTGYRCRDFRDFVHAIRNIDKINPLDCLQYAVTHFEDKIVHEQLHRYLQKINDLNFYRK